MGRDSTRSRLSPTHLAVQQLSPAALGLGWLTKRERKKKDGENNEERKGGESYLITLFVQEEVND